MPTFNDFNNPQVARLPNHLRQYMVAQHYEHYTPVDQAIWRFVMRQNYSYLKDVAYYPYIPGLEKAGLTIEKIPDLQEMNDALAKIGWGAVTVDGFIPPAAFMEFQAYQVLVIAADIRQLEHIEYTPAPDIIHESAGHAPIIADADYNKYLSYFGSIGAKAIFSAKDFELYEAIRELSILKESPLADETAINQAEQRIETCQLNLGAPSEMALLSRLHWWTVEYGLIGTLENPKIYGAGLLSSIGESATCMDSSVEKLWYKPDTVNYPYDITKPQPQLFVTPDFQNLINVLEKFADTMAFRQGGAEGLKKAIACKNTCTVVYSSGLQVSGIVASFETDNSNKPAFLKLTGSVALACNNKQIAGQGKNEHQDGFSSPVGKLKNLDKPLETCNENELQLLGIIKEKIGLLEFENGIIVHGIVKNFTYQDDKLLLISFVDCTVKNADSTVLFEPSWGIYDMAVGEKIVSVFCGAADKDLFEEIAPMAKTLSFHPEHDEKSRLYQQLFKQVRNIRQSRTNYNLLPEIRQKLKQHFSEDWLCTLEILELASKHQIQSGFDEDLRHDLVEHAQSKPQHQKLIYDGLFLVDNPVIK